MDKYYEAALAEFQAVSEMDRNGPVGKIGRAIRDGARGTAKYLGVRGSIGAGAGLVLTGGPVGMIIGAIAGRYAPQIARGTGKAVSDAIDTATDSSLYEDIDSTAGFTPSPDPTAPTYEAVSDSWNPFRGRAGVSAALSDTHLPAARNVGRAIDHGVRYGLNKASNLAGRVNTASRNAGKFKRLEALAEDASKRTRSPVSARDAYNVSQAGVKAQAERDRRERAEYTLAGYTAKLNFINAEIDGGNADPALVAEHNNLVDSHNKKLRTMREPDFRKYRKKR